VLQSVAECCRVLQECCRVLQSVAECGRVLQSVAECCSVLHLTDAPHLRSAPSSMHRVVVRCSMLQCLAAYLLFYRRDALVQRTLSHALCCSVLSCVAVCCSVLQCVAVCCRVLPCVAVRCSVLQGVAARLLSCRRTPLAQRTL